MIYPQTLWCLSGHLCSPPLSLCLLLFLAGDFCLLNSLCHMLVSFWSVGTGHEAPYAICMQILNMFITAFRPGHTCAGQFATSTFLLLKKNCLMCYYDPFTRSWTNEGVRAHSWCTLFLFFLDDFHSNNLEPPPTLVNLDALTATRRFLCSVCWRATWSVTASWKGILVGFAEKDSMTLLI